MQTLRDDMTTLDYREYSAIKYLECVREREYLCIRWSWRILKQNLQWIHSNIEDWPASTILSQILNAPNSRNTDWIIPAIMLFWSHIRSGLYLKSLIIPKIKIGLDKVTTMMASMMLATTSAMTMGKTMKIQTCANAITHGDVPATMETTMKSYMKITTLAHQRRSTRICTAGRTTAPIRVVIAIVRKISANCVKNLMKIFLNTT